MALLDTTLKSVSRSFYTSLRILPSPLRPVMGLGYLFCRAADSIADCALLPAPERLAHLQHFRDFFSSFPMNKEPLQTFMEKIRMSLTDAASPEAALLQALPQCASAFNDLSKTDQVLIQNVTLGVIRGMEMDLRLFGEGPETVKPLGTNADLENYLNFIGGEPGRFWTSVLVAHGFARPLSPDRFMSDGVDFGKGLQMVNILKDIPKDLALGRCYLPTETLAEYRLTPSDLLTREKMDLFLTMYHTLIDETIVRLRHGTLYLSQLGGLDWRLRAAVWWPVAIGLKTLAHLRHSSTILDSASPNKINRKIIYKTLAGSFLYLPSNKLIRWEFERLAGEASASGDWVAH